VIETLAEDARGLRVVARVTHPAAAGLVERGALTGLSFGYRVRAARGENPRELVMLDLAEVSLVAAPMQPAARVIAVVKEQNIPEDKLDPTLKSLLALDKDGMLECWILLNGADQGIVQDYAAYRAAHRDLLHAYMDKYVVHF